MIQMTVEHKFHLLLSRVDSNSSLYVSSVYPRLQTNLFNMNTHKMHEHEDEIFEH